MDTQEVLMDKLQLHKLLLLKLLYHKLMFLKSNNLIFNNQLSFNSHQSINNLQSINNQQSFNNHLFSNNKPFSNNQQQFFNNQLHSNNHSNKSQLNLSEEVLMVLHLNLIMEMVPTMVSMVDMVVILIIEEQEFKDYLLLMDKPHFMDNPHFKEQPQSIRVIENMYLENLKNQQSNKLCKTKMMKNEILSTCDLRFIFKFDIKQNSQ